MVGCKAPAYLNTIIWGFYKQFLELPPSFRSEFIARLLGEQCVNCTTLIEAIRFAKRVTKQSGPPLSLLTIMELLDSHFSEVSSSGNWINRVFQCIETSLGLNFENGAVFLNWLENTSMKDVSYGITQSCHEKCFPKPSIMERGYSHYACFRAAIPDYVGVHYLVAKRSLEVRKSVLILTGNWRWTKPFLHWKNNLEDCQVCKSRPDLDLPHLVIDCKITIGVRSRYAAKYGEGTTFTELMSYMGEQEKVGRLIWLLGEVYGELASFYTAPAAVTLM
jgi:hypothetical protein